MPSNHYKIQRNGTGAGGQSEGQPLLSNSTQQDLSSTMPERQRDDSWHNKDPRMHQQEYERMSKASQEAGKKGNQSNGDDSYQQSIDVGHGGGEDRRTPFEKLNKRQKVSVNKRQKMWRIVSSTSYFLASLSVTAESVLNFICVKNGCEQRKDGQANLWWPAALIGCATGFLFTLGSIAHVIADHTDIEKEGGIYRSRWDSLLAVLSSWLTVLGAVGFGLGGLFVAINGPDNDQAVLEKAGRWLTVVGVAFFFIGLLIERTSQQMKLIDSVEAGRHDERDAILWSMAATITFCQFEVVFLIGAVVDVFDTTDYTLLGHVLWAISGVAFILASAFEFISNIKEEVL